MNKTKNRNGFTLLELLVVVLIIGILAAIALPQYKLAVGKSQYSTLKNITKSLKEATDRYYLANNSYPTKSNDLDINLPIITEYLYSDYFYISLPNSTSCTYNFSYGSTVCKKNIFNVLMYYNIVGQHKFCHAYSSNKSDISHKICQHETGKKVSQASCSNNYCEYAY